MSPSFRAVLSFKHLLAAGALCPALALIGCSSSPQQVSSGPPPEQTPIMASEQPSPAPAPAPEGQHVLAFPTGERSSSALLLEKDMPPEVRLNKPFDYQLRVTNQTDQPIHAITVREQVPAGLSISNVAAATTRPAAGGAVEYNIGDLGPHQTKTITVTAIASQPGTKDICATVKYTPSLCVSTNVINPILKVSKAGPANADICQPIIYTYTVRNDGTGTERNVQVTDRLPDGLSAQDGSNTITLNFGDLPGGQSRQQTVTLKATRTGQFSSQATATGAEGDRAESNMVATAIQAPKLELRVDGPQTAFMNKPVTYHVTVTNTGDAPARDLALNLQGPSGSEVAAVPGGQPQLLSNQPAPPAEQPPAQPTPPTPPPPPAEREGYHLPGGPGQPEYNLIPRTNQTPAGQAGPQSSAEREGYHLPGGPGQPEYNLVPNQGQTPTGQANSQYSAEREGYHLPGGPGQPEYNLIPNQGQTGQAGQASVATARGPEQPSGGAVSMQATGSGGTMMATGQQSIASLAPGQSQSFDVTVPNPQPGVLKLSANAQAQCAQPASASAQTTIEALAGLQMCISGEANPVRVGDSVTYDISVRNQGSGDDHNVKIVATLPDGESYVTASGPTQPQVNGQTITFAPLDTLHGGQTVVWKVQAKAMNAGDKRFRTTLTSQGMTAGPATAEQPTRLY